jgi:hypothetical protein
MLIDHAPPGAKGELMTSELATILDNAGFLHRHHPVNFRMNFTNWEQITGLGHASNPDNEESKDTNPHNTERPLEQMSTMVALNNLLSEPIHIVRTATEASDASMISSDTGLMMKRLESFHSQLTSKSKVNKIDKELLD